MGNRTARLKRVLPSGFAFLLSLSTLLFGLDSLRESYGISFLALDELVLPTVGICTWVTGAWLVNSVLQHFILEPGVVRKGSTPIPRLMVQIIFLLVYAASLVGIVGSVFHKSVTGLITASGAIGIVVGFGLRPLLSDAFTGIALNIERPFVDGDFITVQRGSSSFTGRVVEINWRATRLVTLDRLELVVPNGLLAKSPLKNFSKPTIVVRRSIYVQVGYDTPPPRVHEVIMAALADAPLVLREPAPTVVSNDFKDSGIEYWMVASALALRPTIPKPLVALWSSRSTGPMTVATMSDTPGIPASRPTIADRNPAICASAIRRTSLNASTSTRALTTSGSRVERALCLTADGCPTAWNLSRAVSSEPNAPASGSSITE